MICYMGIDPGLDGAIAIVNQDGNLVHTEVMPNMVDGTVDAKMVHTAIQHYNPRCIAIEHVNAFYKASSRSSFSFGRAFGMVEAVLMCSPNQWRYVRPTEWQKPFHKGLSRKISAKERSLVAARQTFPNYDFRASSRHSRSHDGMVDAALIAKWCWMEEIHESNSKVRQIRRA